MCKATHPSGGMDSLNPCRWRGKRLHHHGGDVHCVVLWLCVAVKLIVCKKVRDHNRKVNILPYYKVNGIIFCPTYCCTIPASIYCYTDEARSDIGNSRSLPSVNDAMMSWLRL
jgi:hypothetical protein